MGWYGNWAVVIASILFFTLFAVGFAYAPKKRDWKTLGIYEAFMVALFTEMFGFPLTIFLLSSILGITIEPTGETGHLQILPPSAVSGNFTHYFCIHYPVAHYTYGNHVANPADYVYSTCKER